MSVKQKFAQCVNCGSTNYMLDGPSVYNKKSKCKDVVICALCWRTVGEKLNEGFFDDVKCPICKADVTRFVDQNYSDDNNIYVKPVME